MLVDDKGKKDHVDNIGNRSVSDEEVQRILDYLQGAVYCWCNNLPEKEFSVQKLFGDGNKDWTETPIQALYTNRCKLGSPDPVEQAGIDCGHLMRRMLQEDRRKFRQTSTTYPGQHYKWLPK